MVVSLLLVLLLPLLVARYMYAQPAWQAKLPKPTVRDEWKANHDKWGKPDSAAALPPMPSTKGKAASGAGAGAGSASGSKLPSLTASTPAIDRTPKMYIGGQQKRPDGSYSRKVVSPTGEVLGQVGDGNRKDVRDAVEAAHKAAPDWGKRAAYNRAQICYYIAENLRCVWLWLWLWLWLWWCCGCVYCCVYSCVYCCIHHP